MDFVEYDVEVAPNASIEDFKQAVYTATGIPVDRQRLIRRGVLLKDSQNVQLIGLRDGDIINLVAYSRREEDEYTPASDLARLGLEGIPNSMLSRRRRRYARRRDLSTGEQLEAIKQNIFTLEDLLKTRTRSSSALRAFDFERRQLHIGQWVDVKDTVDQWLEAQVISLQAEPSLAFIHYNGWPEHWDEWIQVDSPRIQPFRTHTVQPLTALMSSPLPVVPPDADGLIEPFPDIDQYLMQSCALIEQVSNLMEQYYTLKTLLSHDRAESRTLPTRERLAQFNRAHRSGCSESVALSSHATGGSEGLSIDPCLDELPTPQSNYITTEQELAMLITQLAPILDRAGRLMTDLASLLGNPGRQAEDFASVSSSLLTNESGLSANSRQALQIPVMPGQHELNSLAPGYRSSEMDVHLHLLMPQGGEEERHDPCWRQVS